MPPRPQFSKDERNFLVLEYHRRRGTRNFKHQLIQDFLVKFPGTRAPSKNTITYMWEKQMELGTVLNCNSKTSPGDTHSGRTRLTRTPSNMARVKAVLDRDAPKVNIG